MIVTKLNEEEHIYMAINQKNIVGWSKIEQDKVIDCYALILEEIVIKEY